MTSQRLNGSKVLKGVSAFALACPPGRGEAPLDLCRTIAEAGVNLPYVTLVRDGQGWLVTLAVETPHQERVRSCLSGGDFGDITCRCGDCIILSLFPHQSNPGIPGALFESLGRTGLAVQGLANSPSALSLLLREEHLEGVSRVLFEAFTFRTYSTPEEWKAAQKGKEALYKEVVASYQEKHPKVYGVNCQTGQRLVSLLLDDPSMAPAAPVMMEAAERKHRLSLITSGPSRSKGPTHLTYCLPGPPSEQGVEGSSSPASVFSMNGPHFGDRYGITSELLKAFHNQGVSLLALNCTVASITGAVPDSDLDAALEAIQSCFEVPTIFRGDAGTGDVLKEFNNSSCVVSAIHEKIVGRCSTSD